MNKKMTRNSQLSTNELKKTQKTKNKPSKQIEQEQNHRNGDHKEGYQQVKGGGNEKKLQAIGSINGR